MNTAEKVQLVIDIANERRPVSDLREALDDSPDNFIKLAVDHCVGSTLKRNGAGGPMFRFKIIEQGAETFTEWAPERSQFDTSMAMGQLRKEHPHGAISIERQY